MCRVKFLFLLAFVLSASACQSVDTIAVLNNTEAPLRLEYTFKDTYPDLPTEQLNHIAIVAASKAGGLDCPWVTLSPSRYSYDKETKTVILQVPPGMAIRIAQLSNYVETNQWAASKFPIASITIDGVRGTIHSEGENAREQFKNLKRSLYAVDYK